MSAREDTWSSTVDGAAAFERLRAENYPYDPMPRGELTPGPPIQSEPYINVYAPSNARRIVRKPCEVCGVGPIPHLGDEVMHHTGADGRERCSAGTAMFG